jgi:hypothetical protein
MRKLKLESLNVESFDTTATTAPRLRGTVAGYSGACKDTGVSYCDTGCDPNTYRLEDCGETMYHGCVFDTCFCVSHGAECPVEA